MLDDINLRDKIRNDEIRRTKVKYIVERITELKWHSTDLVARLKDESWTLKTVKWKSTVTKRCKGRS